MKLIIFKLLIFLTFFNLNAFAGLAVDGRWSISERVCSSGARPDEPAQDRFKLGRDQMILEIVNGKVTLSTRIQGERWVRGGFLSRKGELIISYDTISTIRYNRLEQSDINELIIVSEGFGPGGSCRPDEKLFSIFTRI